VFGGTLAAFLGLRHAFFVTAGFYLTAFILVLVMYREHDAPHTSQAADRGQGGRRPVTFRNVLAFENFLLMAAVIFGLQFVDRSFGPVLPLFVGELGTSDARVPFVSGVLFSITAGAGAIGHHFCATLLKRHTAPELIAAACAAGGAAMIVYVLAGATWWLMAATPIFGLAIGVGTTAAYTAAAGVIPANVRGTGFGLLTTASLVGLAVSPIVCGLLAASSRRAVFALDVVSLAALAFAVYRLGAESERAPRTPPDEPVPENV
jgi:DHA1 family multidrug resistance protein-like MFS transporter